MRKLFLSLICFGLISSNLFADDNSQKGSLILGAGIGFSSIKEDSYTHFYETDLYFPYTRSKNVTKNNHPILFFAGYRFYATGGLAFEPRVYIEINSGRISPIYAERLRYQNEQYYKVNEMYSNYNQNNFGFDLPVQYDLIKFSQHILGIELGIGYEYSFLNNKFANAEYQKMFEFKNSGTFTFGYGIYAIFNNAHKFSINGKHKAYKDFVAKTANYENETEARIIPSKTIYTLSYSYLF